MLSAEAIEVLQVGRRMVLAGWCQGKMHDLETGAVCAYGAIFFTGRWWEPVREALFALEDDLGLAHADEAERVAIAGWNDAPERTLADVVGLFDRVLAKAAARELVEA